MAETDNLKLALPASNEYVDVEVLNENFRKIDTSVLLALAAAAPYSSEQTYALGAYCTRGGKLYRCTTAISAAEVWTDAHWTETTMGAELVSIYTTLQNKPGRIGNLDWHTLPLNDGISHGDYVDIRYAKDDAGMVYLYVLYQYSQNNASTWTGILDIATLPVGFRPQLDVTVVGLDPWIVTGDPKLFSKTGGSITISSRENQYGIQAFAIFPAAV